MITLSFNEIFKDYESFKTFTDTFKLYADETGEAFNKHIYYCLKLRYNKCALAYETEDEFKAEFALTYNQYFRLFLTKQELLEKMYDLKDDDLILVNEAINNLSNNPNYITQDPWELLDYTSIQNRSQSKSNKLQAYILAMRTLPDAQINAMLEMFDYLWLDILDSETQYYFEKE